MIRKVV